MNLTQEELDALPALTARATIKELRAIHIHQGLRRRPATVETEAGHFRLSKTLGVIAAKALQARTEYKGPTDGVLGRVLARIAFGEEDSVADSIHEEEESEDPMEAMAEELARESLERLRELTRRSTARLFSRERGSILTEALASLTKTSRG